MKSVKTDKAIDQHWITELILFADNTASLQNQNQAIRKNLMRKIVKGIYDPKKAITLWTYYAESARQAYRLEFQAFCPKPEMLKVAEHYALDFEDLVRRGYVSANDLGVKGNVPDSF